MQWRSNTVTSSDFDFERPQADLTARVHASPAPFKQADLEVFDFPAGYTKQRDVDSLRPRASHRDRRRRRHLEPPLATSRG